jgi:acetate kinase
MTDPSRVLVFNAGSSSLKVELFTRRPWRSQLRADAERVGRPTSVLRIDGREPEKTGELATHGEAAELILERMRGDVHGASAGGDDMLITAHRFVHGGASFRAPVVVTSPIMARLDALASLAPLHNPASLAVMRVVRARLSDVPMVAVFDTAFFRDLPEHVRGYAIPWTWRRRYQVERYGFHGIAHEYLYRRYRALIGAQRGRDRVITLQLGQGCSAAALLDGRAIETSMGFTPLEGLIMGTRPGDLDAGVILHLARQGFSWQALEDALNRESGLLGLSGASDDVQEPFARSSGQARRGVTLAAFAIGYTNTSALTRPCSASMRWSSAAASGERAGHPSACAPRSRGWGSSSTRRRIRGASPPSSGSRRLVGHRRLCDPGSRRRSDRAGRACRSRWAADGSCLRPMRVQRIAGSPGMCAHGNGRFEEAPF